MWAGVADRSRIVDANFQHVAHIAELGNLTLATAYG